MFKYFFIRELKESYLGNLSGVSWMFIQPLITLIIYTIVFEKIFKQRIPEAENIGFIVYLAIGFWPWFAFSESIIKSITAVTDKKELIGKVKIHLKDAVFATVTAAFLINLIGYALVLLVLIIIGKNFNYSAIPLLIIPLVIMYLIALTLALILSAIQVFVRDTLQVMSTLMTLWFFTTPIIYSESVMPEYIRSIMQYNPLYYPIKFIHDSIITNKELPWIQLGYIAFITLVLLYFANIMFAKLEPHFEDYI